MRRALVLNDETARHPFRASLPPRVRQPLPDIPAPARDLRAFLQAYGACFLAVLTFVS